jgi:hypothetical protein
MRGKIRSPECLVEIENPSSMIHQSFRFERKEESVDVMFIDISAVFWIRGSE